MRRYLDLQAAESREVGDWTRFLAPLLADGDDILTRRFAVVDDETMAFLWETATQIDARVPLLPVACMLLGAVLLPFILRKPKPTSPVSKAVK